MHDFEYPSLSFWSETDRTNHRSFLDDDTQIDVTQGRNDYKTFVLRDGRSSPTRRLAVRVIRLRRRKKERKMIRYGDNEWSARRIAKAAECGAGDMTVP